MQCWVVLFSKPSSMHVVVVEVVVVVIVVEETVVVVDVAVVVVVVLVVVVERNAVTLPNATSSSATLSSNGCTRLAYECDESTERVHVKHHNEVACYRTETQRAPAGCDDLTIQCIRGSAHPISVLE